MAIRDVEIARDADDHGEDAVEFDKVAASPARHARRPEG